VIPASLLLSDSDMPDILLLERGSVKLLAGSLHLPSIPAWE
jgi:hypothetical protein